MELLKCVMVYKCRNGLTCANNIHAYISDFVESVFMPVNVNSSKILSFYCMILTDFIVIIVYAVHINLMCMNIL